MKSSRTIVSILVAVTFLVPAVAPAATTIDLQSQTIIIFRQIVELQQQLISTLQAQAAQLQAQIRLLTGSSSYSQHWPLEQVLAAPSPGENTQMTSTTSAQLSGSIGDAVTSPAISVTAPQEGVIVRQGGMIVISWQSSNAPAGSAVALFPEKTLTGKIFDPIATSLPVSGSYSWQVPVPVYASLPAPCAMDITHACVGDMNPGTTYRIVARLYTPRDADFVEFGPTKTYPIYHAWSESGTFTMIAEH